MSSSQTSLVAKFETILQQETQAETAAIVEAERRAFNSAQDYLNFVQLQNAKAERKREERLDAKVVWKFLKQEDNMRSDSEQVRQRNASPPQVDTTTCANSTAVDAIDSLAILLQSSVVLGMSVVVIADMLDIRVHSSVSPTLSPSLATDVALAIALTNVMLTVTAYLSGRSTFKDCILEQHKFVVRIQVLGFLMATTIMAMTEFVA